MRDKFCISESLIYNWEYAQLSVRSIYRDWMFCRRNGTSPLLGWLIHNMQKFHGLRRWCCNVWIRRQWNSIRESDVLALENSIIGVMFIFYRMLYRILNK